jgi:hypothetical protein
VSSEGLARGAGELSCAELDSTVSSPSGSGFSIFGVAGGADVPSFLFGWRITASSRCPVFARLFWSAEGPSFCIGSRRRSRGSDDGGCRLQTRFTSRRQPDGQLRSFRLRCGRRAAQFLREAGQWIGTPTEVPGRSGSRGLRELRFARWPVRGWSSRRRRRSHRPRFGARQRFRSRPPFGLQRPHVSFA